MQKLAECNRSGKLGARDKLIKRLKHDCLVSRDSKKSVESLPKRKMQIKVASRKLLKANGENGDLRLTRCTDFRGLYLISYCEYVQKLGSVSCQR